MEPVGKKKPATGHICVLFPQNMNGAEIIREYELQKKTKQIGEDVKTGLMKVTRAEITELFLTGGRLSRLWI